MSENVAEVRRANKNLVDVNVGLIEENEKLNLQNRNLTTENVKLTQERNNLGAINNTQKEDLGHLSEIYIQLHDQIISNLDNTSNLIDNFLKNKITGKQKYYGRLDNLISEIDGKRQEFLQSLREYLRLFYPNFIEYIRQFPLTEDEYNWVMLFAIGLGGTEIEAYLNIKGFHVYSSKLRAKLGLKKEDLPLARYIPALKMKLDVPSLH